MINQHLTKLERFFARSGTRSIPVGRGLRCWTADNQRLMNDRLTHLAVVPLLLARLASLVVLPRPPLPTVVGEHHVRRGGGLLPRGGGGPRRGRGEGGRYPRRRGVRPRGEPGVAAAAGRRLRHVCGRRRNREALAVEVLHHGYADGRPPRKNMMRWMTSITLQRRQIRMVCGCEKCLPPVA